MSQLPRYAAEKPYDLPITIRPLDVQHIREVLRIEQRSYTNPWNKARLQEVMSAAQILVALHQRMVIGYLVLHAKPPRLDLWNLTVDKPYRRRGVAWRLLAAAKARVGKDRVHFLRVDVPADHYEAQQFYAAVGFRTVCGGGDGCIADTAIRYEWRPGGEIGLAVLKSILEGDCRVVRS